MFLFTLRFPPIFVFPFEEDKNKQELPIEGLNKLSDFVSFKNLETSLSLKIQRIVCRGSKMNYITMLICLN